MIGCRGAGPPAGPIAEDPKVTTDHAPGMAVHRSGSGPDLVLFHGGMGSWKHCIRNIEQVATRFTEHALEHPLYGDSAPVARETTGGAYLDLVLGLLIVMFPGN